MHRFLVALLIITFSFSIECARADDPSGLWRTEGRAYQYRIQRCGELWCVHLAWVADNVLDTENPDPTKRTRRVIGIRVVSDGASDGENSWRGNGYWYGNGNTYAGFAELIDNNTLKAWGCIFGSIICVSTNLYRITQVGSQE